MSYFSAGSNADSEKTSYRFEGTNVMRANVDSAGTDTLQTDQLFRDAAAWYHVVITVDTPNAVEAERTRFYVNGTRLTGPWGQEGYPAQDDDIASLASGEAIEIGRRVYSATQYFDGYMADVVFIDGQALTPSSFGEFDSDSPTIWKPKDPSGLTFGNNGFWLDFEDSANLGNDANGGTDLTENNIVAADQAIDTPTNNFVTFNPVATTNDIGDDLTFSEGNCKIVNTADGAWHPAIVTIPVTNGKWYCEFKITAIGGASKYGVIDPVHYGDAPNTVSSPRAYLYEYSNGGAVAPGQLDNDYGDTFTTDDIISVAVDLDNNKLYFAKNGTYQSSGDPTSGATGTGAHTYFGTDGYDYVFVANIHNSSNTEANFGGCSAFAISSGNADANGYGNFEYAVPSGYYALCTKNLAEYG